MTKKQPESVPPLEEIERWERVLDRMDALRREEARERHKGNKHEVKEFTDSIKLFEKAIKAAAEAIEYNRFSPEAVQYLINRLTKIVEAINGIIAKFTNHDAQSRKATE